MDCSKRAQLLPYKSRSDPSASLVRKQGQALLQSWARTLRRCRLPRSPAQCRKPASPPAPRKQILLYPDTLDDANYEAACHILNAMVASRGCTQNDRCEPRFFIALGAEAMHPASSASHARRHGADMHLRAERQAVPTAPRAAVSQLPCACAPSRPGADRTKGVFHLRLRSDSYHTLDLFAYTRSPHTS